MFRCLECGKKLKTVEAAERAIDQGCPRCGGVDIDVAPIEKRPTRPTCPPKPEGYHCPPQVNDTWIGSL